jgi:hypothetical protein
MSAKTANSEKGIIIISKREDSSQCFAAFGMRNMRYPVDINVALACLQQ